MRLTLSAVRRWLSLTRCRLVNSIAGLLRFDGRAGKKDFRWVSARQEESHECLAKYNFDALARLGMPSGIVPNYHRFLLAVQNGNDFESGWCSESDISGEATGLLRLLEEQFDDESWDLIENSKR